jgi:hypothetical protein
MVYCSILMYERKEKKMPSVLGKVFLLAWRYIVLIGSKPSDRQEKSGLKEY